jgi:hypothetical protein
MKKIILVFIFVASILSGCTSINNVEQYMKPPTMDEDTEEVKNVIYSKLPGNAEFLYPTYGNIRNSIFFVDVDGNGSREALVFNYVEGEEAPIYITVLSKKDSFWAVQYTIKNIGFAIDQVEIVDLNNDNKKELILGWQRGDIVEKGITIYSLGIDENVEVFQDVYSKFVVGDLNKNNVDELFLIKRNSNRGTSKAQMYEYVDSEFELIDSVHMEGYIDDYYAITFGKADSSTEGIFIDARIGDRSGFTDLIIYENDKFKNVFYDTTSKSTAKTFKTKLIESRDVDSDGIIEIATLRTAARSGDINQGEKTQWIRVWNKWDSEDGLLNVYESFQDEKGTYQFILPKSWDKNIGIETKVLSDESSVSSFYYLMPKSKEEIPLMELYSIDSNEWTEKKLDIDYEKSFIQVDKKYNKVFMAYIYPEIENTDIPTIEIDTDTVKENFIILNLDRDGGN